MLKEHLEKLCSDLELGALAPKDKNKCYALSLSDCRMTLQELDPGFYIKAVIGECPKEKKEDLFLYIMRANFLGQGTGGNVIGLDEEEKNLTLSQNIPYDSTFREFKETIEDFVNYVDYWREELKRHQKAAQDSIL